jgi:hypothetical protein
VLQRLTTFNTVSLSQKISYLLLIWVSAQADIYMSHSADEKVTAIRIPNSAIKKFLFSMYWKISF